MKKSIVVLIVVVCILGMLGVVSTTSAADSGVRNKFLLSLGCGIFKPGSDASDYKQSPNLSLSSSWMAGDFFAVGMDLNYNKIDLSQVISGKNYTSEIATTSLELLFYIQPNAWKVQPYFGVGAGDYYNNVTSAGL